MTKKIALCVDIGGTFTKFAVIDESGNKLGDTWQIPTNLAESGKYIPSEITRELKERIKDPTLQDYEIAGIGIGIPGFSSPNGIVKFSGNIGWVNYDIKKDLLNDWDLPIYVHNDCDNAALGEFFVGSANEFENIVFLTLGTGLGAGVIINKKLYIGSGGNAGEFGHIPSQGRNPKHKCSCGLPECAEPTFSATGLISIYNKLSEENPELKVLNEINGKTIWNGVKNGDELCKLAAEEFAEYGGRVLATVAMTFNPDRIILGGGLSNNNEIMLEYLNKVYLKFTNKIISDVTKVVLCKVGNDSGLYGAAYSVLNKQ